MCRIPAYEAFSPGDQSWSDLRLAKRFLQYLQLSRLTKQWVLKSPDHVHNLKYLLAGIPDAVVIETPS